jgi:hypothetical protein
MKKFFVGSRKFVVAAVAALTAASLAKAEIEGLQSDSREVALKKMWRVAAVSR